MRNRRILFVSSPVAGGAERMTVLYARILQSHGYECQMLLTRFKRDKLLLPSFIPETIPYKCLKCSRPELLPYQLAWHVFRERPDAVFCSQPNNALRLLQMKQKGFIKAKIIFRDFLMPSNQINLLKTKKVSLFSYADAVIAQTSEMKGEMIKYYGLSPNLITVINNPIDKELIHKSIKEKFNFDNNFINYVAINRVDRQKDMLTMFKALSEVKKKNHKIRLYICGNCSDPAYMKELLNYIEVANLSDSIYFEGPQSNPFKYLYYADVFLLSSIFEGLPNGLLEALYLGKPVVVTHSIPFIKQIVQEGITGYTVDVGDYKSFASAMIKAPFLKIKHRFEDTRNSEEKVCELFDNLFLSSE